MSGSILICAMLMAGADPAPPPRPVKPDVSFVTSDHVFREGKGIRDRILRVGFRNGKPLPPEVIYEREWEIGDELSLSGSDVRAGRYLVLESGSVLDLREKKFINSAPGGVVVHTSDTKATYWIKDEKGKGELFAFEFATEKRTRLEQMDSVPKGIPYSPNGTTAIDRRDAEFTVRRAGQKPKSLGRGFEMGPWFYRWTGIVDNRDRNDSLQTVLWLDDNRILAHRKAGRIVAVSLDGKEVEVVAIKNVPDDAITELSRDPAGAIVYSFSPKLEDWPHKEKRFKIDVANKTATPTEGIDLGHGFTIAYAHESNSFFHVRYNGKEIGELALAHPELAVSAPGYLAIPAARFKTEECSSRVGVWSAATREWTIHEHNWIGVLGLIK